VSPASAAGRIGGLARSIRWYLREVTGETAYDRYVEHVRRDHPGAGVRSRRDFERWRQDDRNDNPRARCC
jgi:uncharacterized short protein YbdD (DUF466 family)